jgi:hypothetical protein
VHLAVDVLLDLAARLLEGGLELGALLARALEDERVLLQLGVELLRQLYERSLVALLEERVLKRERGEGGRAEGR